MEPDFSGFVSKANLPCTDGRTIGGNAFAHQDGEKVPVVYQHNHTDVMQVLGHAILSKKPEGMWGDIYLNEGVAGQHTKMLVKNGDLDKFSIWAKELEETGHLVHDGVIQEVSLVLAGANPGARVEQILAHSGFGANSIDQDEDLNIVTGDIIMHSDVKTEDEKKEEKPEDKVEEEKPATETEEDPLAELSEEQRTELNEAIDEIVTDAITQALAEEPELTHDNMDSSKKGTKMSRNIFQNQDTGGTVVKELKHSDVASVIGAYKGVPTTNLRDFAEHGSASANGSLRDFIRSSKGKELMHADTYGIDNIEVLFPDAQALMSRPTFVDRRQEWVKVFLAGTSHSPFSRVKTFYADITADEARARGYIKGNQKVDEVFPVFKRETGPAWIYKRQKLDRQDIIEIVDFDVVAWMKVEMRGKLDEELARAALFGDGRPAMIGGDMNPDKIVDPGPNNNKGDGIRAIINDHELYTITYSVPLAADATGDAWNVLLDTAVATDEDYMGGGNKTAFMSFQTAAKLLTIRDDFGHRIYRNLQEVAGDMGVARIVKAPTALFPTDVLAIVLDLQDYNFGTNRGGEVTLFDDFDINVNQFIYLIETYLSGALTMPYSAQVYKRVDPTDTEVIPTAPAFAANVVTIPTQTGVVYKRMDTGATVTGGSTITLDDTDLIFVEIEASPAAGYYFPSNDDRVDTWTFEYQA